MHCLHFSSAAYIVIIIAQLFLYYLFSVLEGRLHESRVMSALCVNWHIEYAEKICIKR